MAKQKNIVGDLHNVQYARIGDDIHIHLTEPLLPKELTLYIPRTHPEDIIGRESDLNQLHKALHAEKRVVVVNGIGGIGKTTLAQAYVSRYYETYQHILWVTQESDDIARDFINAPGLLRTFALDTMEAGARLTFEELLRRLKTIRDVPNLLIIDNGERSLRQYRDLLPGQPHWHLLVTSRDSIPGFHRQSLGSLDEEQAIALFKKHYPHQTIGEAGIKKLVKETGYHTLTIEIMAKMAAVQRYDLPALQKAIRNDLRANVEIPHSRQDGVIRKIGSYLRTSFNLSRLNQEEIWLLQQWVCLPPEPIPYPLLRELLIDEKGPHAHTFSETLTGLSDKGWLQHNQAADSFTMHRIIAEVVRKERPVRLEDVQHLLKTLSEKLNAEYTLDNTLDKFGWVPYGKKLLAVFPRNTSPGIAQLQNRLGFVLLRLEDLSYARVILEKAIRSDSKNYGKDHPITTMHINNLALVIDHQGDPRTAKRLLEKALRNDEKNLGLWHPHTAIRVHNLGMTLQKLGDFNSARALLERNIDIVEKNFGTIHPATARAYSHLALLLKELGELRKARALLKKAVKSDEVYYGVGHPAIMENYDSFGTMLQEQGKYAQAKPMLEKALASTIKVFGEFHPLTAIRYNNLAVVLGAQGDHLAARSLLEKAVEIGTAHYGTFHRETGNSLANLAIEISDLGDKRTAVSMLRKAIRILEKTLDPTDEDLICRYSNIIDLLEELDRYPAALPFHEKNIRACEKVYGKNHLNTAYAWYYTGLCYLPMGKFRLAAGLVKKAMPIFRRELPPNNNSLKWIEKMHRLLQSGSTKS